MASALRRDHPLHAPLLGARRPSSLVPMRVFRSRLCGVIDHPLRMRADPSVACGALRIQDAPVPYRVPMDG